MLRIWLPNRPPCSKCPLHRLRVRSLLNIDDRRHRFPPGRDTRGHSTGRASSPWRTSAAASAVPCASLVAAWPHTRPRETTGRTYAGWSVLAPPVGLGRSRHRRSPSSGIGGLRAPRPLEIQRRSHQRARLIAGVPLYARVTATRVDRRRAERRIQIPSTFADTITSEILSANAATLSTLMIGNIESVM